MPDLPVPPVMPAQFPPVPVNIPVQPQSEHLQDTPIIPPPGAPPSPGAPISQEAQQPFTYPQQQFHQPPPPHAPMPTARKKSNTGLIIGLSVGGVALIVLAVIIGIVLGGMFGESLNDPWVDSDFGEVFTPVPEPPAVNTPSVILPVPDPQPEVTPLPPEAINHQLLGEWTREHGDFIWFFGLAERVVFNDNGDGTFGVSESEFDEIGTWYIDNNGDLIVEGEWTGTWKFNFSIDENSLTLIDSDGDTAHYSKVG